MVKKQNLEKNVSQFKFLEWAKNHICMSQWLQRNVKRMSCKILDQVSSKDP